MLIREIVEFADKDQLKEAEGGVFYKFSQVTGKSRIMKLHLSGKSRQSGNFQRQF